MAPYMDAEEPEVELTEEEENAAYWAEQEAQGEDVPPEDPEDDFDPRTLPIKLAIVGRPNVGKSTLTNRILGEDRVVVYDMPGTTRDSIYIPMTRDDREYILIDTAGVRKRGKITETVENSPSLRRYRQLKTLTLSCWLLMPVMEFQIRIYRY